MGGIVLKGTTKVREPGIPPPTIESMTGQGTSMSSTTITIRLLRRFGPRKSMCADYLYPVSSHLQQLHRLLRPPLLRPSRRGWAVGHRELTVRRALSPVAVPA